VELIARVEHDLVDAVGVTIDGTLVLAAYMKWHHATPEGRRQAIELLGEIIEAHRGPRILLGDLNAKTVGWGGGQESSNGRALLAAARRWGLCRLPCEAPTFTSPGANSTIDHILFSESLEMRHVQHLQLAGLDHALVAQEWVCRLSKGQQPDGSGIRWDRLKDEERRNLLLAALESDSVRLARRRIRPVSQAFRSLARRWCAACRNALGCRPAEDRLMHVPSIAETVAM
jgi:hypothetical protein